MLVLGVILTLLVEVRLNVRYQGVDLGVLVLVHRYTGSLVQEENILVLVNNIELRLYPVKRERNALGLVKLAEKLLGKEALYSVTLHEHGVVFRALAVDLYLLCTYRFV